MGDRLRDATSAFRHTLRNRDLRRVQLAFGAANAAELAFTVGIGVVAFADGGAGAVAAIAVLRLLPSALLTPLAASLADRWRRERVLMASALGRAVPTALAAAVLAADGPVLAVYALAVVSTIAVTPFRAAHSALLPSLCTTTEELTSSNVVRGMLDALSVAAGPLVAAVLLGVAEPWAVFAAAAAMAVAAAVLVTGLRYEPAPREVVTGRPRPFAEAAQGFRAIAGNRAVALLMALFTVQTFVRGALTVFVVVVAIDVLGIGEPGVGLLQGAMGVGAVLGSLGSGLLVGSKRMAAWFGLAVVLWGLPLCAIGVVPEQVMALAMLAVVGVANSLIDVTGFTMLARLVPDAVLGRTLGAGEALWAGGVAAGALVTAPLIALIGVEAAFALVGTMAPLAVALAAGRLRRIDRELDVRDAELAVLRGVPLLRPLPAVALEHLARTLQHVRLDAGEEVFAAGEPGDAFYVIGSGTVDVLDGDRLTRTMGPGEAFGEIALLRDVPRTRTVRVREPVDLHVLRREHFLPAVTGFGPSASVADATVDGWLSAAPSAAPRRDGRPRR